MVNQNNALDENFIRLLHRYEKLVFSICYRMTNNYYDAEDLTQNTFLAAYRAMGVYHEENEKAWITKIAANQCMDYFKSASRRMEPSEDSVLEERKPPGPSAEEEVEQKMIYKQLEENCRKLKPPYDEVALAYYKDQKTAKEIALERGKSIKTIQTQLARAKTMLKSFWRKEDLV